MRSFDNLRTIEFGKVAFVTAILLVSLILSSLRAEPSDDEKKALQTAGQSFKDGAFDLCNDRIASLLKKYPKTELAAEAELLQAQALYQLGRSDAALAALNLPLDPGPPKTSARIPYSGRPSRCLILANGRKRNKNTARCWP